MSHKGKAIGSTLGIIAGVSYGLAAKHSNWAVAGLAIGGAVGGAILGGMFDKQPTVVIPVDDNGNAKTPVVADTVGEETANDTAGDDGMMSNAIGRIGGIVRSKSVAGGSRCNITCPAHHKICYTDCTCRNMADGATSTNPCNHSEMGASVANVVEVGSVARRRVPRNEAIKAGSFGRNLRKI
jgi:hypothetical protein